VMVWIDVGCVVPLAVRIAIITDTSYITGTSLELYIKHGFLAILANLITALSALRFLKMTRYLIGTKILLRAMRDSATALVVPVYLLTMLVIFFGSILFALEYNPLAPATLPDITTGWWMLIVTMTTVGYGDYSPTTGPGRIVISVAMFSGLLIIAMPLAIVGNNFSEAWQTRNVILIQERVRRRLLMNGHAIDDVVAAFRSVDTNGTGYISYTEFKSYVRKTLELEFAPVEMRSVWRTIDGDETDEVKFLEFAAALFPKVSVEMQLQQLAQHKGAATAAEQRQIREMSRSHTRMLNVEAAEDHAREDALKQALSAVEEEGSIVGGLVGNEVEEVDDDDDDDDGVRPVQPADAGGGAAAAELRAVSERLACTEAAIARIAEGQAALQASVGLLLDQMRRDTADASAT